VICRAHSVDSTSVRGGFSTLRRVARCATSQHHSHSARACAPKAMRISRSLPALLRRARCRDWCRIILPTCNGETFLASRAPRGRTPPYHFRDQPGVRRKRAGPGQTGSIQAKSSVDARSAGICLDPGLFSRPGRGQGAWLNHGWVGGLDFEWSGRDFTNVYSAGDQPRFNGSRPTFWR